MLKYALEAGFEEGDVTPSSTAWCYADPELREWRGSLWAMRVQEGKFREYMLESEVSVQDIESMAVAAWKEWSEKPDG